MYVIWKVCICMMYEVCMKVCMKSMYSDVCVWKVYEKYVWKVCIVKCRGSEYLYAYQFFPYLFIIFNITFNGSCFVREIYLIIKSHNSIELIFLFRWLPELKSIAPSTPIILVGNGDTFMYNIVKWHKFGCDRQQNVLTQLCTYKTQMYNLYRNTKWFTFRPSSSLE